MDDILIIDVGGHISSLPEPTCELRWEPRFVPCVDTNLMPITHSVAQVNLILQQRWQITDYRGGERIGLRSEWRDVPTATPA